MLDAGVFEDKYRYLGSDSPRGTRWYNFDPLTYLECAVAGSFQRWEPGDNSMRQFVPGETSVMDDNGNITSPIQEINSITWDAFKDFLWFGQYYE